MYENREIVDVSSANFKSVNKTTRYSWGGIATIQYSAVLVHLQYLELK